MLLEAIGERVKYVRQEKKISQKQLSESTGIVREQISRIEHGQINLTIETLYKLSVAFNMGLKELLDIELEMPLYQVDNRIDEYKLRPFVKWAGGKKQIIDKLKAFLPLHYDTYFEPFVGGGALLFDLKPKNAIINDINNELYAAYACFNDDNSFQKLIKHLLMYEAKHSDEYYYEVRSEDRKDGFLALPDYVRAARMIYLNKACFNGLYRVNSNGFFNVPSGKKPKVKAYDKLNFDRLREYFKNNKIIVLSNDFEEAVKDAKSGDFVYFDPPYDSYEEKDSFTSYSKDAFDKSDQERLACVYKQLNNKGVNVMLSNHNTKYINALYQEFNIHVINAKRMINSDANGRGNVEEVIITNY